MVRRGSDLRAIVASAVMWGGTAAALDAAHDIDCGLELSDGRVTIAGDRITFRDASPSGTRSGG